jgi:lipoprotein-anchoring transpeptidase ErfK/SrfK
MPASFQISARARRLLQVSVGVILAVAVGLCGAQSASAAETVKLLKSATVRPYPGADTETAKVPASAPLTGAPTVLPVIGHAKANGRPWVRVRLPQRPNGATGWISADGTALGHVPWKVEVDISRRHATLFRASRPVRRFAVVVGKPSTPTPTGVFFVTETVRQPAGTATGPVVMATSAHSNALQEFGGGPGQIGLHGRTGLPDPLGAAASSGCVRFADQDVRWLAARARAGTPVTIRR